MRTVAQGNQTSYAPSGHLATRLRGIESMWIRTGHFVALAAMSRHPTLRITSLEARSFSQGQV
ncbi:MAG: hypothetical protein V3V08_22445 [Nannocystaceae bacterium]